MGSRVEQIGEATLYLGDCLEILPTLPSASSHLVFTDPPYGHNNNNGDLIHRREAALGHLPSGSDTPQGRPIANDGAEANDLFKSVLPGMTAPEPMVPKNSPGLLEWLANGERGVSSNTIVEHLTGINATRGFGQDHPYDPADLRRCLLLLEQVPALAECFDRMATCSPQWRRLVSEWDELTRSLTCEVPDWRSPRPRGRAEDTYRRMRLLIKATQ